VLKELNFSARGLLREVIKFDFVLIPYHKERCDCFVRWHAYKCSEIIFTHNQTHHQTHHSHATTLWLKKAISCLWALK
jgi:hypothetical protein